MSGNKDAQQRTRDRWERILGSPLSGAYLTELYWLARDTVETCDAVFSAAAPPPDQTSSYIKVDHVLQANIYRILNNAARIRALVKDRPRREHQQSAAQYAIQEQRTHWLSTVVTGIDLSEVAHARVRNSLEHFDEYLDQTALRFSEASITGRALLPFDMTLGRDGSLDQFADGGSVYPLRVYLAEERIFVNCGHKVDLGKIATECLEVVDRLTELVPTIAQDDSPTSRERGSSMIVLTSTSFGEGGEGGRLRQ